MVFVVVVGGGDAGACWGGGLTDAMLCQNTLL